MSYCPHQRMPSTSTDREGSKFNEDILALKEHFTKEFSPVLNAIEEEFEGESFKKEKCSKYILFIGNTGAGKSRLVDLLVAVDDLKSEEVFLGSGEFLINNIKKKGTTETIVSDTLYPNLYIDKKNKIGFCDNPGFNDTRTSIHEIKAACAMNKMLSFMKKVKIVVVVNKTSLETGMYRDDFKTVLNNVIDFIKPLDKYKDSIYLVATKVDNKYTCEENDERKLIENEVVIKSIVHFLNEAKTSFEKELSETKPNQLVESYLTIISSILSNNETDTYLPKISIFRRPEKSGSVASMDNIKKNKEDIISMLINKDNFVELDRNDFGYSISDTARVYLITLFSQLNCFMTGIISVIGKILTETYSQNVEGSDNIWKAMKTLTSSKEEISKLITNMKSCGTLSKFLSVIGNIEHLRNMECLKQCLLQIKNINDYFECLQTMDSTGYISGVWVTKFEHVERFLMNELLYYNTVEKMFLNFSSYEVQTKKHLYCVNNIDNWGSADQEEGSFLIDESNLGTFFEKCNLCLDFTPDVSKIEFFNLLLQTALIHGTEINIENNDLIVCGQFVCTSQILEFINKSLARLQAVNRIIIISQHTLFIDKNLEELWFKGKTLVIVAPIWRIVGNRVINVDGKDGKDILEVACTSEINGRNGNPGGNVTGIGLEFYNYENLHISACGGNGQDGKDGVDGTDGTLGRTVEDFATISEKDCEEHLVDCENNTSAENKVQKNNSAEGAENKVQKNNSAEGAENKVQKNYSAEGAENKGNRIVEDAFNLYLIIFNRYREHSVYKGEKGTQGTDGTQGGKKGYGGVAGKISVISLKKGKVSLQPGKDGSDQPGIEGSDGEDGKPGKGGADGDDIVYKEIEKNILFIKWFTWKTREKIEKRTGKKYKDGIVREKKKRGKDYFQSCRDFANRLTFTGDIQGGISLYSEDRDSDTSDDTLEIGQDPVNLSKPPEQCRFKTYVRKEFIHNFLQHPLEEFIAEAHKIWVCNCNTNRSENMNMAAMLHF